MSFVNTIITDSHTFGNWCEKELALIFKQAPTVLTIADMVLTYSAPLLVTVISKEAGTATGAEVSSVINKAIADIVVIRAVVYDAGPNPTAQSLLQSVSDNLSGLLTASKITDPASVALVTKVVNELASLLKALEPTPATTA